MSHLEPSPSAAPHLRFDEGEFWRSLPGYEAMSAEAFLDPAWQARHAVRTPGQLQAVLGPLLPQALLEDVAEGLHHSTMNLRVTPYLLARMDWTDPIGDPLRRQFIPLASEFVPDHPEACFDSLHEQDQSPVPGLVRRYPDKALFLTRDTCPVYCRYCTRSYALGHEPDQPAAGKHHDPWAHWSEVFTWLEANPDVEDVVVSGGDVYHLGPEALRQVGEGLLAIPSLRRIRLATRGLAANPGRIQKDGAWTSALLDLVATGRQRGVSVALHVHFNHPREITWATREAADFLFREGVLVRNQSVLLRGVNDSLQAMGLLVKRLGYLHIDPYYVYLCDMVPGQESLRTSLQTALDLEKGLRGLTAGFHMPTFVVDLPGGGGKRDVHSFESYEPVSGVSMFRSPRIDPGREYRYFDPLQVAARA